MLPEDARYTDWSFGELPELMEIRRKAGAGVGFPALVGWATPSASRRLTSPRWWPPATTLRRPVALQIRDTPPASGKNIPICRRWPRAWLPLLWDGRFNCASRSSMRRWSAPRRSAALPTRATSSAGWRKAARLTLIAGEVAAGRRPAEHAAAARKIKDTNAPEATRDAAGATAAPTSKNFLAVTPSSAAALLPRYPRRSSCAWTSSAPTRSRDAQRMAERRAEKRLAPGGRTQRPAGRPVRELRWLLEEQRQLLRPRNCPQPVSVKRLEKGGAGRSLRRPRRA